LTLLLVAEHQLRAPSRRSQYVRKPTVFLAFALATASTWLLIHPARSGAG
jgi:hypothetical protein